MPSPGRSFVPEMTIHPPPTLLPLRHRPRLHLYSGSQAFKQQLTKEPCPCRLVAVRSVATAAAAAAAAEAEGEVQSSSSGGKNLSPPPCDWLPGSRPGLRPKFQILSDMSADVAGA